MKGKLKQIQKNKKNNHKFTKSLVVTLLITGEVAFALPTGENIVTGNVEIIRDKNQLIIKNSDGSIIDWKNFDTYKDEIVKFLQENNDSRVLNRILDGKETFFDGLLSSNANVYLINTSGILFGQNAKIDTKSLVASSLDISNKDFLDKKDVFSGNNGTKVENQGLIVVKDGKLALIGNEIKNSGIIKSENGNILLAAGAKVVIQDLKNRAIAYEIQAPNGKVINLGDIIAKNGKIDIRGKNIKIGGIVSTEGKNITIGNKNETTDLNIEKNTTISSSSDDNNAGDILMWGDKATYSGNYSAKSNNANGGLIETSGKTIKINDDIKINTTSKNGKTGTWLIDPINVTITDGTANGTTNTPVNGDITLTGSTITNGTIVKNLQSSNVIITTDGTPTSGTSEEGKIDVNADIIADNNNINDLTLKSHADINIKGTTNDTTTNRKIDMKGGALNLEVGKHLNISDAEISVGKQSTWKVDTKSSPWSSSDNSTINFTGDKVKLAGDISVNVRRVVFDTKELEQSSGTLSMRFDSGDAGRQFVPGSEGVYHFKQANIKLGSVDTAGNIALNTRNNYYWNDTVNANFANDVKVDGNGEFKVKVGYLNWIRTTGIEFSKGNDLNITANNKAKINFEVTANKPNKYKFVKGTNVNLITDTGSSIRFYEDAGSNYGSNLGTITHKGDGEVNLLLDATNITATNILNEKDKFNFTANTINANEIKNTSGTLTTKSNNNTTVKETIENTTGTMSVNSLSNLDAKEIKNIAGSLTTKSNNNTTVTKVFSSGDNVNITAGNILDLENTAKNDTTVDIQKGNALIQVHADNSKTNASLKLGGAFNIGQGAKLELLSHGTRSETADNLGNTKDGVYKEIWNATESASLKSDIVVNNKGLFAFASKSGNTALNMNNHSMSFNGGTNTMEFIGFQQSQITNVGAFNFNNNSKNFINLMGWNTTTSTLKDINLDNSNLYITSRNIFGANATDTYQNELDKYINRPLLNLEKQAPKIQLDGNITANGTSNLDINTHDLSTNKAVSIVNNGDTSNTLKLQAKTVDTSAGALTLDKWGTNDISVFDLNKGKTNAEFKVTGVEGDEVLFKVLDKQATGKTETADSTYGGKISVSNKNGTDTGIKIEATVNNNLIVAGSYENKGDITAISGKQVTSTGTLNSSNGSITIKGEQGTTINGDITAKKDVTLGEKATTIINANNLTATEGNLTITGEQDININTNNTTNKTQTLKGANVTITSINGDVNIGNATGSEDVKINSDSNQTTSGKVEISGKNVTLNQSTKIGDDSATNKDDIIVTANGTETKGVATINTQLNGKNITLAGNTTTLINANINASEKSTIGKDGATTTTTINGAVSGNTGIDVLGNTITTVKTGTLTSNNGYVNVGNDKTTTATIEGNVTANTNTVTIKSNESTTVKNNTVTADAITISSKKDVVLGDKKYNNTQESDGSDKMIDTKFIAKTTMEVKGSNSVDIYKDVEFKPDTTSNPNLTITSKTINSDGKITAGNITLTGESNNDSTINLGGKVESKGDIKVSANDVTANGDIKTTTANETGLNGNITIVGTNSTNTTATISTDKGAINLGVDESGTTSKTTTISGGTISGTDKVTIKANDSVAVNSGTISGKGVDISSTEGSVTLGDKQGDKQGTADTIIKSTDEKTPINVTAKTDLTINSDAKLGDDTTKSDITLKGSNITSEGTLTGKAINIGDENTNTTTISGGKVSGEGKVSVKAKDDLTIKNTEVSSKQEVEVNANNVTIGDDSSNGVDTKITTTDSGVVNITGTNKVDIKKDSEINSSTNATINGGTLTNDGKITGTDNVKVTGNNVTSNGEISSTNTTLFGKNSTTNTGTISGVSVVNIGSNGNEKSNSTTVSGNVTSSNGKVDITSTGTTEVKNAEVKGATEVSVTGKDITIGDGSDNVDTKISTTGTDGKVKVDGTGTIKVNKDTEITSSNTSVNGDNVTTDGKITGTNEVKVTGDNVTSNGTISSDKTTTLFGKNSTSVTGGSISGTNGVNIGTNGTDKSTTTTVSGNVTSSNGKVDITATNDVTVDNTNVTGSGVNISSDKGNVNIGNGSEGTDTTITTTGKNEPDNNLTISAAGTTTINKDSNLTSAGNIAITGDNVTSNGTISSDKTTTLFGKNSTSVTGGSISGTNGVNIGTDGNGKKSNSTTVSGNVTSSNGKVGITATNDVTVVDGVIKGEAGVDLTGANITVGNAKGDKDTIIDGGNGAINVKGDKTTINKDSNLTSKNDITLAGNSEVVVSGDIKTDKGIKVDSPNGTTTIKDANLTSNDLSLTANKDVVFKNSTSTSKETTTIKSTTGNVTIGDNKGEKDTIINTGGNLDITSPKDITINSDSNLYSKKDINVDGKDVVVDGGKISADKDINLNTKVEGDNNVIVKDNNGNRGNITSNAQLTIGNGNTNLKLTHSDITSGVDNGFKTNLDKAKLDMDYDSTIDGSKKSIKSTFINFIDAVIDIKDKIFAKGIARQERVDYQGKYEIEDIEHKKSTKKITGKGSVKVEEITK